MSVFIDTIPLLKAASGQIATSILKDIADNVSGKVKDAILVSKVNKVKKRLLSKIFEIRQVKTIWQTDKPIDLIEFYCEQHVVIGKNQRVKINTIDQLPSTSVVLIEGIAGQGKSILLKYLCAKEFERGEKIPVFFELRNFNNGFSLLNEISKYLIIIGIDNSLEKISVICKSNKLMLFLDGFDEAGEIEKNELIKQIDSLSATYPQLRIIISSRFQSEISKLSRVETVSLDNISGTEYQDIINKLCHDSIIAKDIIQQVMRSTSGVISTLKTPLMVTLLVITYKSDQTIPQQLSQFYDKLFSLMLQRHDGTKPGFKRSRKCKLNDHEIKICFEAFCYEAKHYNKNLFSSDEVLASTKEAISRCAILNVNPEDYISDIVKITCLLLSEGGLQKESYRFIHKSIQEYYSASFIKSLSEPLAKLFYTHFVEDAEDHRFSQELSFLSEIDQYRFIKYYRVPFLRKALCFGDGETVLKCPMVNVEFIINHFGDTIFYLGFDVVSSKFISQWKTIRHNIYIGNVVTSIFFLDLTPVYEGILEGKIPVVWEEETMNKKPKLVCHDPTLMAITEETYDGIPDERNVVLLLSTMLKTGTMTEEIVSIFKKEFYSAYERLVESQEIVNRLEHLDLKLGTFKLPV